MNRDEQDRPAGLPGVEILVAAVVSQLQRELCVPRYTPSRRDLIAAERVQLAGGPCFLIPKSALDQKNPLKGKATDWLVKLTPCRETRPRGILE